MISNACLGFLLQPFAHSGLEEWPPAREHILASDESVTANRQLS